jgi:hypothetical protein
LAWNIGTIGMTTSRWEIATVSAMHSAKECRTSARWL